METEDTLSAEKKVYTTPELVDHGDLVEMTQGHISDQINDVLGSGEAMRPPR